MIDEETRLHAEQQCAKAVVGFFSYIDRRDYDRALAYITDDCVWKTRKSDMTGRAEIRARMEARPMDRTVVHLLSSVRVEIIDADNAEARSYITIYAGGGELPLPSGPPLTVGAYTDRLVRHDGRWLIREKSLQVIFQAA